MAYLVLCRHIRLDICHQQAVTEKNGYSSWRAPSPRWHDGLSTVTRSGPLAWVMLLEVHDFYDGSWWLTVANHSWFIRAHKGSIIWFLYKEAQFLGSHGDPFLFTILNDRTMNHQKNPFSTPSSWWLQTEIDGELCVEHTSMAVVRPYLIAVMRGTHHWCPKIE